MSIFVSIVKLLFFQLIITIILCASKRSRVKFFCVGFIARIDLDPNVEFKVVEPNPMLRAFCVFSFIVVLASYLSLLSFTKFVVLGSMIVDFYDLLNRMDILELCAVVWLVTLAIAPLHEYLHYSLGKKTSVPFRKLYIVVIMMFPIAFYLELDKAISEKASEMQLASIAAGGIVANSAVTFIFWIIHYVIGCEFTALILYLAILVTIYNSVPFALYPNTDGTYLISGYCEWLFGKLGKALAIILLLFGLGIQLYFFSARW